MAKSRISYAGIPAHQHSNVAKIRKLLNEGLEVGPESSPQEIWKSLSKHIEKTLAGEQEKKDKDDKEQALCNLGIIDEKEYGYFVTDLKREGPKATETATSEEEANA